MDWQLQLTKVYVNVCDGWKKGVFSVVQRFSNNVTPKITDEEIVAIYLYGLSVGNYTVESIYAYADRHLRDFFPKLAGSNAFRNRLNRLGSALIELCRIFVEKSDHRFTESDVKWAVDSMPIIMAGPKRSNRAKVASDLADKGYCASKDLYFYGVKLHLIGILRPHTIPAPSFIGMAPASYNDHPMFEAVSGELHDGEIFGDKAYGEKEHQKNLAENQNLKLFTPIKKKKFQFSFPGPEVFSSWVSSVRQPIESLFNWINEKTHIQNATKVRSSAGLTIHVFGRLSAAILMLLNC